MKAAAAVLVLAAVASARHPAATVGMVRWINSNQTSWRASLDSPLARLTREEFRSMLGVDLTRAWNDPLNAPEKKFSDRALRNAPDTFDPRLQWPHCKSMTMIRDQSDCGSCWAFGAVSAMSDRECIAAGKDIILSAEDMTACSGAGSCNGGYPSSAYSYYHSTGVVTEDCRAYSLPSCDHHIPGSTNPCPSSMYPTPKCDKQCKNGATWANDKHKAKDVYTVRGEANMMAELSQFGPCEGAFSVYEDFVVYTGGVYHHVSGKSEGGHAIKVMGYGVDNNVKYWLIANSWNEHWGEKGYFRIRRGTNECGIENTMWCGTPASA